MITITNNPARRASALDTLRTLAVLILIAIATMVIAAVVDDRLKKHHDQPAPAAQPAVNVAAK